MLSVIMLTAIMLNVTYKPFMLSVNMLSVIMLSVIMRNVTYKPFMLCQNAECHYAECCGAH